MPDLVYLWLSIFTKVFCGIEWVSSRQGCEWVGRVILSQSRGFARVYGGGGGGGGCEGDDWWRGCEEAETLL